MKRIAEAVDLFLFQSRVILMRMLSYRLDFTLSILTTFIFSALGPLFQFLLYSKSRGYPGWSFEQILVFQAVLLFQSGLCEILFGSVRRNIDGLMEKGEFDRLLLKPRPPLTLVMTGGFNPSGFGSLLVGILAIAWSVAHLGFPAGLWGLCLFVALILSRIALQAAVQILYCFFSVRWVYTMRLDEIMDKVMSWGGYPLEVFPRLLRVAFSTILPFSIACYWPAKALIGPIGLFAVFSVAGTGAFLALSLFLWRRQLAAYASAGG